MPLHEMVMGRLYAFEDGTAHWLLDFYSPLLLFFCSVLSRSSPLSLLDLKFRRAGARWPGGSGIQRVGD